MEPAACKEDFRTKNYTIITSKCKGPEYPKKACCAAFLEFVCPMADLINDMRNDCAILMFCGIERSGPYPHLLFFNKCRNGTHDLNCPIQH
ncbi:hypothetical protein V6N11_037047 [Hibiscus sabdariffa]|uniref:GPI-anchored protein LLG1-like domain-containing protein n=1 Tax=Hibiscus sabdariffa TaxID=183260 RepID=A0ABR2A949_9ROSI